MEFYISPDQRQSLEHKLNLMFKHLSVKPEVKISPVEAVVKDTIYNYGFEGYSRQRTKISACHVEIEDIRTSEWVLVATVDYKMGRLLMGDARYFKNIPYQYGINYTKCDHCGSEHKNRLESHIMYNPTTDTWMQVGSTCINKMLNGGKYLNGLMVKLYDVISMFGGCDPNEWAGGYWRPSNKYRVAAISMEDAMLVCDHYRQNVSDIWVKAEYSDYGVKLANGTNDELIKYFGKLVKENSIPEYNEPLLNAVNKYYDAIEYGEVNEYDKTLTQKIKDALENEYITLNEMYLPWFAVASYENSLTTKTFEAKVKDLGIEKGSEFNFCGDLKSATPCEVEDYNGWGYHTEFDCIFEDDATGLRFNKSVANMNVVEKMKQTNGKYKFTGTVKYIAYRKQMVCFCGRLKKTK